MRTSIRGLVPGRASGPTVGPAIAPVLGEGGVALVGDLAEGDEAVAAAVGVDRDGEAVFVVAPVVVITGHRGVLETDRGRPGEVGSTVAGMRPVRTPPE